MRFASLGSGSRGNATVVQAGNTLLLVDCGYPVGELERRLERLGVAASQLHAILVTHEHADHIKGVGALARRYGTPVWMTDGTLAAARCGALPDLRLFTPHCSGFTIGGLDVLPFPVPHDAREPVQFVLRCNGRRLGMLTDTGSITPHIVERLKDCDALVLECNHDRQMLAEGPYPPQLRARVGGDFGHLSNTQAAGLLQRLDLERLQWLTAAHLSEKNNTPVLAYDALTAVSSSLESRLVLASQDKGTPWREIG